ncbi:hypothetical protein [Nannocystis sp. SCPEA4]|uniref:hypothetical protein n=1 Tax=Nannocystis sp. SCPEA4 TaxID=2996787 RepID=UPI00227134F2|nr:hypothetical protein [Nannocystis sp. SCPEA4]MCY1053977.1 hypothetical protein [Nannocystis sp. SCPEA4]
MLQHANVASLRPPSLEDFADFWQRGDATVCSANFREIVHDMRQRVATHYAFPYPGKVIPHIPRAIIALSQILALPTGVFDPCCGSGTVLLEAALAGQRSVGVDINPLAALVSRVKVTRVSQKKCVHLLERLNARIQSSRPTIPDVVNLDMWFSRLAIERLGGMRTIIDRIEEKPVRELFQVAFAKAVRACSLADPRMPVPVRPNLQRLPPGSSVRAQIEQHLQRAKRPDVAELMRNAVTQLLAALSNLPPRVPKTRTYVSDARHLALDEQFGLVLTSPPYGSAQKYIRSSSLALGWLGLATSAELSALEAMSIGREHVRRAELKAVPYPMLPSAEPLISSTYRENPARAHLAASYLADLSALIRICRLHLAPRGAVVMVLGDTSLLGRQFPLANYAIELARMHGLALAMDLRDRIRGRGLLTKRRSGSPAIQEERVLIFREAR